MKPERFTKKLHKILDPEKVKILLIGTSIYPDARLEDIPNVIVNIKLLSELFMDEKYLGIPEDNLFIALNENKLEIERTILRFTREVVDVDDTVIVYYAGHGLISSDDFSLYLATSDTTLDLLEAESLSIKTLKKIFDDIAAQKKILIIDSCHSGQVLTRTMSEARSKYFIELGQIEGTYILASAPEDSPAFYPEDSPELPTYFTGVLVDVIKNGVQNEMPVITIDDVYNSMRKILKQKHLPEPVRSVFYEGNNIPIAYNVAYEGEMDLRSLTRIIEQFRRVKRKRKVSGNNIVMALVSVMFFAFMVAGAVIYDTSVPALQAIKVRTEYVLRKAKKEKHVDEKLTFLLTNAKEYEQKGGKYYRTALLYYERAERRGSVLAKVKKEHVEKLIDSLYRGYMDTAEKFMRTGIADSLAMYYYKKALELKPRDQEALKKLDSLEKKAMKRLSRGSDP